MTESALDFEKRPLRYNAIDGVDEMLVGVLLLTLFLLLHVTNIAPEGSIWRWKPIFLIGDTFLLVVFLVGRKLLRERITYRRTGYVKYRSSKIRSAIGVVIAGMIAAVAVKYVSNPWDQLHRERNLIMLGSLLWSFLYTYFYIYKTTMHSVYRYVTALVLALGPVAVYSAFPGTRDISTLSAAVPGACFLISGVVTFYLYLRNTNPAHVTSENESR